jgi:hypothetical protein
VQYCINTIEYAVKLLCDSYDVLSPWNSSIEYIFYVSFLIEKSVLLIIYTDTPSFFWKMQKNNMMIADVETLKAQG